MALAGVREAKAEGRVRVMHEALEAATARAREADEARAHREADEARALASRAGHSSAEKEEAARQGAAREARGAQECALLRRKGEALEEEAEGLRREAVLREEEAECLRREFAEARGLATRLQVSV